jgi:hypothetical protein
LSLSESTAYLLTSPVTQPERMFCGTYYKRLSCGRYRWWPERADGPGRFLQSHELHVLLSGGNPATAAGAPLWRPVLANT